MGGIDAFLAKFAVSGGALACTTSRPQVLTVQAGSASALVGDLLLNCTGGMIGTQVTANIQVALNTTVAGTQPEVFVGSSTNPIWGVASGNTAVLFQGISFAAPGPSANITLRITNVWANVSSIAVGGQVIMTVSVPNSNPSLTVWPAQQTVAIAQNVLTAQLQQLVLSTASAPANCSAPPPASGFLISDAAIMVWFLVGNVSAGDVARVDWSAPFGAIYQSHSLTATGSGTQCLWDSMNVSGSHTPMAGAWNVNIYWNGALLTSTPFVVSTAGIEQLIYQNQNSGQVNADYYGGNGGATLIGWACLSCGIDTSGWRAVAVADFDGNGVPDLIYQNTQTGQVNVDYYSGAGGATFIGWACLSCGIDTTGWELVAVADFDGNGVPDLVYQNTQTGQVNVNYYGGAGGATFIGWACLSCGIDTAGWQMKAVADLDGNGTPDLIYQNTQTGQVNANYYGGHGGATFIGWACLSANPGAGWSVASAK